MVAITVILAAVIGSFVLGIGGDVEQTPQVRMEVTDASGNATVSGGELFVLKHNGGDTVSTDDLRLVVENSSNGNDISNQVGNTNFTGDITVGDSITISEDGVNNVETSTELDVRIVHQPSDSLLIDTTVRVE